MNTPFHPTTAMPHPAGSQILALRDIHLPAPVSWWPPAPGWWLLLFGLLGILVVYFVVKKIRARRRLRRATNAALDSIQQQYMHHHNKIYLAKELSILLRRASISFYPRRNTAGLTGKDWLHFLDHTLPEKIQSRFNSKLGEILLHAPYMPDTHNQQQTNSPLTDTDAEELLTLCKQWLRAQPVKKLQRQENSGMTTGSVKQS